MCGRFNLFTSIEIIVEDLNVEKVLFDPPPRYNIAPTQTVASVRQTDERVMEGMRWGLIPPWSKDGSESSLLINARAESIFDRPTYRDAIMAKRCIVPANGFFEWAHTKGGRYPYYIRRSDGRPFYIAGIYEDWRSPQGESIRSCSIITTAPDELLAPIHDRMPLLLDRFGAVSFLDPFKRDRGSVEPLLKGSATDEFEVYRVGTEVNSASAEGEGLISPLREWF